MNFIRYALPIAVRKDFSDVELRFASLVQVVKETMPIASASGSHEVARVHSPRCFTQIELDANPLVKSEITE